jgi:hypothetical protein
MSPGRVRQGLKGLLPPRLRELRARRASGRGREEFRNLDVERTFERVYAEGWWGEEPGFDSGEGSEGAVIQPYIEVVRKFVAEHGIRSIADLGCGDFRIGSQLVTPGLRYYGVDVVGSLIERNKRQFESEEITFEQVNLVEDDPPQAELGLLRQVLQHLSNAEVEAVLKNTSGYTYLIVTEHVPTDNGVVPNRDMPHGPDIRLQANSGVFVDEPPFSRPARTLCEVPLRAGESLRTVLLTNRSS